MLIEKKIVLVGAGNIGSRHLQALVKLPYKLTIDIVEKIEKNFQITKSRLGEINYDKSKIELFYHEDIKELDSSADLVIIATNSNGRADLFCKLLEMGYKKFLVEKIVTQSKKEYERMIEQMKKYEAKVWIDTARVYFDSYQKIKKFFKNSDPIHISVNCGNEGLGCNAIHFINLFLYFCNDYEIKLNGEGLYNKILPNKRDKNLVEFAGTIHGSVVDGSSLVVTFVPHSDLPFTVEIIGENKHLFIEEKQGILKLLKGNENIDFQFKEELQSSLTTKIVSDIIENDLCLLPTLEESSYAHYELFRIFNAHIKKILNEEREFCPIT